ncbi:MAG: cobyrinic acid a,c-diamide synthase [Firmicutes bacterium HGW-Firmicutes-16]|nr:MAG: cobyrinic acid a,c-diamide synthase [Firmicutes bacterium HGW-Firmicutes-16]
MENTVITVAGKGGVGKTSISAAIVRELVKSYPESRILAIDADPAGGLATALDVETKLTIDDIRKAITASGEGNRQKKRAIELLGEVRFRVIDAMTEKDGFAFIAVGRPEAAGCYCSINAYLKEVISMFSEGFDYVVIDGEAGIEQINRRVMEKVTHLFLVTDPSKKGTQVIQTIKKVADELVMYKKLGIIVNRFNDETLKKYINTGNIPVLAYIPDDKELALFDAQGKNVMELPDDSKLVLGVRKALEALEII